MKTLLLLLTSFVSFAQIPNVNITTYANGFIDPMQTVSINDNTEITLQRNGEAYISQNGIKRNQPIIYIQPNVTIIGEQGALSIHYQSVNGIDLVLIDLDTNLDIVDVRNLGSASEIFFISSGYAKDNVLYITSISGTIYKMSYESTLSINENVFNKSYDVMYYDMLGKPYKSINDVSNGIYIEVKTYDNRIETSKQIKR